MDDFLCEMGVRLMLRRKALNLTQEQVAEKAGVTPQTVSSAERGRKALRPENIVRICAALEISPNYLLLGGDALSEGLVPADKSECLTLAQKQCLERIVESFLVAVTLSEEELER